MTCDECSWKNERDSCPWNYDYKDTDYAEDCVDFRYIDDQKSVFKDYYILYYDPDNIDLDIVDDIYKRIKESLPDNTTLAMLPNATWLKAYGKYGYKDELMYFRDLIDKELESIDD